MQRNRNNRLETCRGYQTCSNVFAHSAPTAFLSYLHLQGFFLSYLCILEEFHLFVF